MRIEFAHGSREPVAWPGGTLRIGSAADNDVRLEAVGVAPRHARLTCDARGLVLEVARGAGRVYVNARPVRERAIVRLGDSLGIGGHRLRLCADGVADVGDAAASSTAAPHATMALRAVAGTLSGRVWPISDRLELNAQGPSRMLGVDGLVLAAQGRQLRMDGSALAEQVAVRINGVATRRAHLHDGDQLAIGAQRFVLDISAEPASRPPALAPPPPNDDPAPAVHREMGWLIATAVVVALVLAWVMLVHY